MSNNSLPSNWKLEKIKDFAHTTSGGTPKRSFNEYFDGDIPWIKSGDLNDGVLSSCEETITELGLKNSSAKLFKEGTLLIALYGATIGRLSILNFEAATNQAVCGISVPDTVDVKYLFYYLLSIRRNLIEQGKGGAQPNINQYIVNDIGVPIAPVDQQKQIVAKIEELFSHIDAGVVALQKAKTLLKQYRQSVLKAAVTGELTREWREQNKNKLEPASELLKRILAERRSKWEEQQLEKFEAQGNVPKDDKWKGKYKEPLAYDFNEALPEIPAAWVWVSPEQIAHTDDYSLAIGPFGSNLKVSDYKDSGVPLVFVRNIRSHYYGKNKAKYVSNEKAQELRAHSIKGGDVLITKMGEPPGEASIFPLDANMAIITADCIKWRLSSQIKSPSLFVRTINSSFIRDQIIDRTKGVAQKKISLGTFKTIAFPLPPFEEQQEISNLVDEKLFASERLMKSLDARLIQAEKNKQSILAAAFSGKLANNNG